MWESHTGSVAICPQRLGAGPEIKLRATTQYASCEWAIYIFVDTSAWVATLPRTDEDESRRQIAEVEGWPPGFPKGFDSPHSPVSIQWRTHQDKPGEFMTCQDAQCPKSHFISSFKGSRPVKDDWEGVKHK